MTATGEIKGIITAGKKVYYTVYKLLPADKGKTLKQIAREQLYDENLYTGILRWLDTALPNGDHEQAISDKDHPGSDWTLLLPPSDFAKLTLSDKQNVRKSHKEENNNISYVADAKREFIYKKSTIHKENGAVWVDVSKTGELHVEAGHVSPPAWIRVTEGTIHHTIPSID